MPANLIEQATAILTKENTSELPSRVSLPNSDGHGSRDHGCMQINDYWNYNKGKGWDGDFNKIYDADFNIEYAYQIYKNWGNSWCAWSTARTLGYCIQ